MGFDVNTAISGDITIGLWFGDHKGEWDLPALAYSFHTAFVEQVRQNLLVTDRGCMLWSDQVPPLLMLLTLDYSTCSALLLGQVAGALGRRMRGIQQRTAHIASTWLLLDWPQCKHLVAYALSAEIMLSSAQLGTEPCLRPTVPGLCHMTCLHDDLMFVWRSTPGEKFLLLVADLQLSTAALLLLLLLHSAASVLNRLQDNVMRVVAKKMDIPRNSAFQAEYAEHEDFFMDIMLDVKEAPAGLEDRCDRQDCVWDCFADVGDHMLYMADPLRATRQVSMQQMDLGGWHQATYGR